MKGVSAVGGWWLVAGYELFSGNIVSIVSSGPYNLSFPGGCLVAWIVADSLNCPCPICCRRFHVRVISRVSHFELQWEYWCNIAYFCIMCVPNVDPTWNVVNSPENLLMLMFQI